MPKLDASTARSLVARGRAGVAKLRPARDGSSALRVSELEAELERVRTSLDARIKHLENVIEGLQDAVYHESVRRDELTAELTRRTDPAEMARAMSEDARRRGV